MVPAHEPGDAVAATGNALVPELLMDSGRAIRLAPALIGGENVDEQGVLAPRCFSPQRRHAS